MVASLPEEVVTRVLQPLPHTAQGVGEEKGERAVRSHAGRGRSDAAGRVHPAPPPGHLPVSMFGLLGAAKGVPGGSWGPAALASVCRAKGLDGPQ